MAKYGLQEGDDAEEEEDEEEAGEWRQLACGAGQAPM